MRSCFKPIPNPACPFSEFISAMMGVTNGIALAVIGLELPAAWGLLTFLANFIPNIGGPARTPRTLQI